MTELYAFCFALSLGFVTRWVFLAFNALARRTDLFPVTVALDFLTAATAGGALTAYIILTGTPLAPYIFAALFSGYYLTYIMTKPLGKRKPKR